MSRVVFWLLERYIVIGGTTIPKTPVCGISDHYYVFDRLNVALYLADCNIGKLVG
jgi:hypothetical protein